VTCADCHGGDPEAGDKEAAHRGDVSASRWQSAVHFENIPETCGECHREIFEGYHRSSHFEHLISLEEEVQGPTCVTCHGSITATALNVNTVREACAHCHNPESKDHPEIPDQAQLLLDKLLSIHRATRTISLRGNPQETRAFFRSLDPKIRELSVSWHTFDLEQIREKTGEVLARLLEQRRAIRKREAELGERPERVGNPGP